MGGLGGCTRWLAVGGLVAIIAAGAARPAQASSLSPRAYYDGTNAQTSHIYCVTSTIEAMSAVWVGYYGTGDVTWPRVGDVYYIHVIVYGLGSPCVGEGYVIPEFTLQPNTQILNNAAYPVYCFKSNSQGSAQIPTSSGCPTAAEVAAGQAYPFHGAYNLFARRAGGDNSGGWWALPPGASYEFQIPVTSSAPMSGIATGSYLYGYVTDIGTGNWAGASQGVFVAPDDRVFLDGFESNTIGNWSASSLTDGGNLSVQAGAAMRSSTRGLQAFVNDTNPLYVQDDHPTSQSRYRARFYLNPGTFDPGEVNNSFRARIFLGFANPSRRVLAVVLKRQGGAYSLMMRVRKDDNTQMDTGFIPITNATHSIEFDWTRSTGPGSNNGALRWWIDDIERTAVSNVDNDTAAVDFARMGAMNIKVGASGVLYFDEFESRTTTAVGP